MRVHYEWDVSDDRNTVSVVWSSEEWNNIILGAEERQFVDRFFWRVDRGEVEPSHQLLALEMIARGIKASEDLREVAAQQDAERTEQEVERDREEVQQVVEAVLTDTETILPDTDMVHTDWGGNFNTAPSVTWTTSNIDMGTVSVDSPTAEVEMNAEHTGE